MGVVSLFEWIGESQINLVHKPSVEPMKNELVSRRIISTKPVPQDSTKLVSVSHA